MTCKTTNKFSLEVCERAVRKVLDHERASVELGDDLVDCGQISCTAQAMHEWTKKAEIEAVRKPSVTTDMSAMLKALELENRELRQAYEILRKASAHIAQAELDRPFSVKTCPTMTPPLHLRNELIFD